jgi:hypothetical protein
MKINLYQIAYNDEIASSIDKSYHIINNIDNKRPDWYEYWPVRHFLINNKLDDSSFYGFFSPKFESKTNLKHEQVCDFVRNHAENTDVFLFSPQPDMSAFFLNVFEQAELFDPGTIDTYEKFLATLGRPTALRNMVMDARQVVFSNYFIARPAFWREWLALNEAMFQLCEDENSVLGKELRHPTSYPGNVQRKVFLQERAASYLLITQPHWRSMNYSPFGMGWSASRFREFPNEAVISDALKLAYKIHGHPEYLSAYAKIRQIFQPPIE